ncbi:sigma-70 family RNA polymerase sigma factor [Ochrobactrum sp. S46]|nr:sigma-70 family RNA polymerase sigma factor [Ochrobactrum sp. S45]MBK0044494.1 sigma-70 family RNA polymerase sigma factor [Ochrobactrum sp. S46]
MNPTFTEIFLTNRKSLFWSVMRIVKDPQTAEDVTQETFMRVSKAAEIGAIEHVEAFLFQTAKNLALNHRRRQELRRRFETGDIAASDLANIPSLAPSQETGLIHRQRLSCIKDAIARLPQRTQNVWILSRIEKWSYPRIANHLGVSPNTVFNDLKMAHAHCVDALAKLDRE